MITAPLFYLAAVPAVILVGLAKGGLSGLGLLALPLMALVVSPVQGAAIMLPILMVQDVVTVWVYRHSWDHRNVLILIPGAAIGVLIGYLWAAEVSDAAVRLSLGVISTAFAIRRLMIERRPEEIAPAKAAVPQGLFWGLICGFTSMVAHAGGPPFQIYVMPQRLPQTVFVGTGAILFTVLNWIKVPPYIALGQFSAENLSTAAALFPLAIASTYAGVWLVRRLSGPRFYTIVYALLILVGGKLMYDGAAGLL